MEEEAVVDRQHSCEISDDELFSVLGRWVVVLDAAFADCSYAFVAKTALSDERVLSQSGEALVVLPVMFLKCGNRVSRSVRRRAAVFLQTPAANLARPEENVKPLRPAMLADVASAAYSPRPWFPLPP